MKIAAQNSLPVLPRSPSPSSFGRQAASETQSVGDAVVLSGAAAPALTSSHGSSCPCCQTKSAAAAGYSALSGAPGTGIVGAWLEMTPELRQKLDSLPVKPEDITHVLYHADCFDGFGARYAAEKVLGDKATYIKCGYNNPPPELPKDAKVAIVDFSFPRQQLLEMNDKVSGLVVLDHHEKSKDDLEGLPFCAFDMKRAGSGLSWAYFHPDEPEPEILKFVEDRDLWHWSLDQSHEVSAALAAKPMDFKVWHKLDVPALKVEGAAILAYKTQLVNGAADRAEVGVIDGHSVPVANCSAELRSEVGEELLKRNPQAPFAAIYYFEKGQRMWSVRAPEGGFNVNDLAKKFKGGGHKAAAGFKDPEILPPLVLNPR